jgi:hypothetical protein
MKTQKTWPHGLPVNTAIRDDRLGDRFNLGSNLTCMVYIVVIYRFVWFVEIAKLLPPQAPNSTTFPVQPSVLSSSLIISTRWSHPLDVRYALERSWCIDEDCHWSFWGSSLEFFRKSVEGLVRKGVLNFSLHHVFEKIWKIWSHVSENDQWQSSSMHQDLCNAYLTSSVCDHLVEMLKLELSTKGYMVEMWSNLELAEAITSRAQRIKQNSKEGQCCPWIKE